MSRLLPLSLMILLAALPFPGTAALASGPDAPGSLGIAGQQGPRATAIFDFEDTAPPPPPELWSPPGWLLEGEPVLVRVGPGRGPAPISGIRGYAISLDESEDGSPCASSTHCGDEEIDTIGGWTSLGILPEGLYFVRAVAVSGAGIASPVQTAEVRIDGTPPVVSLRGVPDGWSDGPVHLTAVASDTMSGMAATGVLGPSTAIAVDGAQAAWTPGDNASTSVAGSGLHRVEYFARDAAGNVSGGSRVPKPESATVRIDEDPPTVAFSPLREMADSERIEASVADALSGASPDRGWIEVRRLGTGGRFEQLPTRVAGDRLIAHWDSDSYPAGRYEFQAVGFDLAGNSATGSNRASGIKMVLANPLKLPVSLDAGFGRGAGRASAKRTRFGRGVSFGGRLQTTAATPVAGVEVAVTESFGAGSEQRRRTTLARTDIDGRFRVLLAPGPTREVLASFAGNRTLTRASSLEARLEVPTSVRLRASSASARVGGAPVVFSGKVALRGTKRGAVAGLPVELQFRFRNGRWSGFRTVEADARGRFRYPYRFSDDDSRGVRFRFRAYVKGREGWPYEPGASRPVTVTGR